MTCLTPVRRTPLQSGTGRDGLAARTSGRQTPLWLISLRPRPEHAKYFS
jgi:hypothetical protein